MLKKHTNSNLKIKIGDDSIPQIIRFKYLKFIIQNDRELGGDVKHQIQARQLKWRSALGIICDKKIRLKLKKKLYSSTINPVILHGTKCWTIKNHQENKLNVAKIWMLRQMSEHTIQDRVRNEVLAISSCLYNLYYYY